LWTIVLSNLLDLNAIPSPTPSFKSRTFINCSYQYKMVIFILPFFLFLVAIYSL
jgi:hypothetical protein